jgi:hypothetical protein
MTWNVEPVRRSATEDGIDVEIWRRWAHARTDRVLHPSHDLIEWT